MADHKDIGEEYHLDSEELMGNDIYTAAAEEGATETAETARAGEKTSSHLQRNALIIFGTLLICTVSYKLLHYFPLWRDQITGRLATTAWQQPAAPVLKPAPFEAQPLAQSVAQPVAQVPVMPSSIPAEPALSSTQPATGNLDDLGRKLSILADVTQSTHREVAGLEGKMSDLQTNMQNLIEKMSNLTSTVEGLNTKLATQAETVYRLEMKVVKAEQLQKKRAAALQGPSRVLFLQAVIPGRAWLITGDGADTLTVREGSKLPGYGEITGIDANQGRVLTSSGKTIIFMHQRGEG